MLYLVVKRGFAPRQGKKASAHLLSSKLRLKFRDKNESAGK